MLPGSIPDQRTAHTTLHPRPDASSRIVSWFGEVLVGMGGFTADEVRSISEAAAMLLARAMSAGRPIAVDVAYAEGELSIRLSVPQHEQRSAVGSQLILYRTRSRSAAAVH